MDSLQLAVQSALPSCSDLREGVGKGQFRPHMSVAQFANERQGRAAAMAIAAHGLEACVPQLERIVTGNTGGSARCRERRPASSAPDEEPRSASTVDVESRPALETSPAASDESSSASSSAPAGADCFSGPGLEAGAAALTWTVTHVHIIDRKSYADPFRIVATIPLGGKPVAATSASDLPGPEDVYEPDAPEKGARCLRRGGNGVAILKRRAELAATA